ARGRRLPRRRPPRAPRGHATRPPGPASCGASGHRPRCTAPRTRTRPGTAATSIPMPRPGPRTTTARPTLLAAGARADSEACVRGEAEQPGQVLRPVSLARAEGVHRAEQPVRREGEDLCRVPDHVVAVRARFPVNDLAELELGEDRVHVV